jgi:hypothetical protein
MAVPPLGGTPPPVALERLDGCARTPAVRALP